MAADTYLIHWNCRRVGMFALRNCVPCHLGGKWASKSRDGMVPRLGR